MKRLINMTLLISMLSGCAQLLENRSFIDEMDHETDPLFVPGQDFATVPGDSGNAYRTRNEIKRRTPATAFDSERDLASRSMRQELRQKEMNLNTRERALYREASPYFESASERIYYLNLSSDERYDYLEARSIPVGNFGNTRRAARNIASLDPNGYEDRSLYMGMSKGEVMSAWGRPSRVDVAGNPRNQNERWSFYNNGRTQYVYFEGGKVQGWQLD